MTDDRKLERFSRKMGIYELAGAAISYGDVVVFTEGVRPGIIIADTPGHRKSNGDAYKAFIEEQIADGWGRMGVRDGLCDLERRVWQKIDEETSRIDITDEEKRRHATQDIRETYAGTALGFAQVEGPIISYLGMGLDFPWLVLQDGRQVEFWCTVPTFDRRDPCFSYSGGRTILSLRGDDVFLLKSDGLLQNMRIHFGERARTYAQEHDIERDASLRDKLPCEIAKGLCRTEHLLLETIRTYQHGTSEDIRDGIVADLGEYFSALTDRRDDVTFAVVKRWA